MRDNKKTIITCFGSGIILLTLFIISITITTYFKLFSITLSLVAGIGFILVAIYLFRKDKHFQTSVVQEK